MSGQETIERIAATVLDHEFFIMIYGTIFYFILVWSWMRNKSGNKLTFRKYWHDQVDDLLVVLLVGCAMIIWDDELLDAYNSYVEDDIEVMERWMYFFPGPVANLIYKLFHRSQSDDAG